MKFSTKDFFSKYDQICRKLRIWSRLLKKSLMENFIFVHCWLDILSRQIHFQIINKDCIHLLNMFKVKNRGTEETLVEVVLIVR